jgi:hypothetical protein
MCLELTELIEGPQHITPEYVLIDPLPRSAGKICESAITKYYNLSGEYIYKTRITNEGMKYQYRRLYKSKNNTLDSGVQ